MNKDIAIIGASYLQKPVVVKAKEMGFRTHVFAWEDGAVCKDIADQFYGISIQDINAISDICRSICVSGVLTIASDICSITASHVANSLGLIGNDLECTKVATDKYLMRKQLTDAHIPCPEFIELTDADMDLSVITFGYPMVVKPVDRSGSIGVTYVKSNEHLASSVDRARMLSFKRSVIVEEFVDGRELSVESISWKGEHYIVQITDKETTGPPYFVENAHHQPASLTRSERHDIENLTHKCLTALGIKYGAAHTEIKINTLGKMYVIEIGARMGGDFIGGKLVELSTGYDYVKAVIEVATGMFRKPQIEIDKHAGIHYIFPQPGIIRDVITAGDDTVVEMGVMVRRGDEIQPITNSGQRPAYYIYQSDSRQDFNPSLLRIITQ